MQATSKCTRKVNCKCPFHSNVALKNKRNKDNERLERIQASGEDFKARGRCRCPAAALCPCPQHKGQKIFNDPSIPNGPYTCPIQVRVILFPIYFF